MIKGIYFSLFTILSFCTFFLFTVDANLCESSVSSGAARGKVSQYGDLAISRRQKADHCDGNEVRILSAAAATSLYYLDKALITNGGSSLEEKEEVENVDVGSAEETNNESTEETTENNLTDSDSKKEENENSLISVGYKKGDGSDSDPEGIPYRFLKMQKGNRALAKKAWDEHLEWRAENNVNDILTRPHPSFDLSKKVISHYFAGRDANGNPIFVQQFGKIDMKYAEVNKLSTEEMLMHYIYIMEYCWNIWEPSVDPETHVEGIMTSILDLGGVTWKTLQDKPLMDFGKKMVSMISSNYPSRSYRTLVINAPKWFNALYRIFKPLCKCHHPIYLSDHYQIFVCTSHIEKLTHVSVWGYLVTLRTVRKSTREKIAIFATGPVQDEALQELLGDSMPKELLSSYNPDEGEDEKSDEALPGPNSKIEQELRNFVSAYIASSYFGHDCIIYMLYISRCVYLLLLVGLLFSHSLPLQMVTVCRRFRTGRVTNA